MNMNDGAAIINKSFDYIHNQLVSSLFLFFNLNCSLDK